MARAASKAVQQPMVASKAPMGRPKESLQLSEQERAVLMRWAQGSKQHRGRALRARLILACSNGRSNRDVAAALHFAEHTVGKWRRRFVRLRLAGLQDRRSGHEAQAPAPATLVQLAKAAAAQAHFGPWSLGLAFVVAPGAQAHAWQGYAACN